MKFEYIGKGAKFIEKRASNKFICIKTEPMSKGNIPINAIRLDDGKPITISLDEEVDLVMM